MEKPNAATVAYYDRNVPADERVKKGQMFGHPCAFVNGNMFFGTFAQTVVVRVGVPRAAALAKGKVRIFEPMPGRAWKEYIQVDGGAMKDAQLHALALEALEATALLPAKQAKEAKPAAKASPAAPKLDKAKPAKIAAKAAAAAAKASKAKAGSTKPRAASKK
jgi:hypothetical protein